MACTVAGTLRCPSRSFLHMTVPAAAADQQRGWRPPAVAHFLCSGRDWAAVRAYYAALVAGDAALSDLGGLQPLAPPPPPAAAPPLAAGKAASTSFFRGSAAQAAEQHDSGDGQQAAADAIQSVHAQQQQPAAEQRRHAEHAQRHERATWKVCLSYYGPAFG